MYTLLRIRIVFSFLLERGPDLPNQLRILRWWIDREMVLGMEGKGGEKTAMLLLFVMGNLPSRIRYIYI